MFNYYGSKSKIAHLYPKPKFNNIIEPFCGGGNYALRYADHSVLLNDLNPRVVMAWKFLLCKDALRWVKDTVPRKVQAGQSISQMITSDMPEGLIWILRAGANRGTFGGASTHDIVTKIGAAQWHQVRGRMLYYIPLISHWQIRQGSAFDIENIEATWFIDPPYNNIAGRGYAYSLEDREYKRLAKWCKARKGQAIVCANSGEDWLPFVPITNKRLGIFGSYQKKKTGESVWLNEF